MGRKIFLIAGEPSGDLLGARLMAALTARSPDVTFCGVGGPEMTRQGLTPLFPMSDLTVMGITEVLPHLPVLIRRITQTAQAIRREKPDLVLTVDPENPGSGAAESPLCGTVGLGMAAVAGAKGGALIRSSLLPAAFRTALFCKSRIIRFLRRAFGG